MKKNMGQKDRVVRGFIGVLMLMYAVVFQNMVGLVGVIPLLTAVTGYCPLYTVLGIRTFRFEEDAR
jgi:hypothetical protein